MSKKHPVPEEFLNNLSNNGKNGHESPVSLSTSPKSRDTGDSSRNGHKTPISAPDLLSKKFAPVQWAVPDLLPEGVTILGGKPKMGKSWMALDLAIAVASGGYALGKTKVDQGETLFLGLEDSERRLQKRLIKRLDGGKPPAGLTFTTEWPSMGSGCDVALDEWLTDHPDTKLVVIDTLKKVRSRASSNRNMYDLDYEAVESLLPIAAAYQVSILLLHHLNKLGDSSDPFDMISGSTGLTGGVDSAMVLKRDRGDADAFLVVDGRDIDEPGEYALKWDKELASWTLKGDAEEYRIGEERRKVIEAVAEAGPMGPKEIADELGYTDSTSIRKLLSKMFRDGQLSSPAKGKYSVVTGLGHIGHTDHDTHIGHTDHNASVTDKAESDHKQLPIDTVDIDNVTDVTDVTGGWTEPEPDPPEPPEPEPDEPTEWLPDEPIYLNEC